MRNRGRGWIAFFLVMIAIGSVFMMNLFVGVVINNFEKQVMTTAVQTIFTNMK